MPCACPIMTNVLYVGFDKKIQFPKGGFLLLSDTVPDIPRARVFNPQQHCFNPLKDINYRSARDLAEVFYSVSPGGSDTLTVRNGRRNLAKAFMSAKRLTDIKGDEEVQGMIDDVLFSPILRRVFCTPGKEFSFNVNSVVVVHLDRKVLGRFDALLLGLSVIARYKGQVVIPDFGFYGRDMHASLIDENRLIAGIKSFSEVSKELKQNLLSIEDKIPQKALFEDAELLARNAGLRPDPLREDNAFNRYIDNAMGTA